MNHSFDIDHARMYGMTEAVLIANFQFWIARNKANGENFRDGRTWTYNSVKAFSELFPYLTDNQIRRALERLVTVGVLLTGNYNQSTYDRTKWFAFSDESIFVNPQNHLANLPNGGGKGAKTVKTDVNQDEKTDSSARGARLPKTWVLPKSWGMWALENDPSWTADYVRSQAEKFRDYWVAIPGKGGLKLDWEATWRNWCRNAGPMKTDKAGGGAWWLSEETKLAKAMEVGVGPANRGEPSAAWEARIRAAIDNGGKPPEPKPKPAVEIRETVEQIDKDNTKNRMPDEVRKTMLASVGIKTKSQGAADGQNGN